MIETRLVGVCNDSDSFEYKELQLPISVEEMRTMVVEFDDPQLQISATISAEIERRLASTERQFTEKIRSFKPEELKQALTVDFEEFSSVIQQMVPCVGCRRCVEKLYSELAEKGYKTVNPMKIDKHNQLSLDSSYLAKPTYLHWFLTINGHHQRNVLESVTKCRKNKRCLLHSLEVHICKTKINWDDLWVVMSKECREECCIVEQDNLHDMLENYLRKHRFCNECKAKVTRAYNLLMSENPATECEKHFNPVLYQGLKYCEQEQHLHLQSNQEFLNQLIERAEPELFGSLRERHAKTLDIAQGEVICCLGIYVYDRLHHLNNAVRSIQQTYQLLYACAVVALRNHFEVCWENQNGLSANLEILCAELQDSAIPRGNIVSNNPMASNAGSVNGSNNHSTNQGHKPKKRVQKKRQSKASSAGAVVEKLELHGVDEVEDSECCLACCRRQGYFTPSPSRPNSALANAAVCINHSATATCNHALCNPQDQRTRKYSRSLSPPVSQMDGAPTERQNAGNLLVANSSNRIANQHSVLDVVRGVQSVASDNFSNTSDQGYSSQELSPASTHCNDFCAPTFNSSYEMQVQLAGLTKVNGISVSSSRSANSHSDLERQQGVAQSSGWQDSGIAAEDIAWFASHQSQVIEERLALRRRLQAQFRQMQQRLQDNLPSV